MRSDSETPRLCTPNFGWFIVFENVLLLVGMVAAVAPSFEWSWFDADSCALVGSEVRLTGKDKSRSKIRILFY